MGPLLALVAALALTAECDVANFPTQPTKFVTDGTGFLTPAAAADMELGLDKYQGKTGHTLIVWIAPLPAEVTDVDQFCTALFNGWGVGRGDYDDAVVLFVFPDAHQYRLRVGYGLVKAVPDKAAVQIGREVITPQLRAGRKDAAITDAMREVMRLIDSAG